MAGAIVNKFMEMFGIPENDEENEEEYIDEEVTDEEAGEPEERGFFNRRKVVNKLEWLFLNQQHLNKLRKYAHT